MFKNHVTLFSVIKKIVSEVKFGNQVLKTVTEFIYLGVVLSDDLSCTKDVERAKACLFKQFFSLHNKFHCMDQKGLIHVFELHDMSFYGVETWLMKLYAKDLNNISIAFHKAIKCMCNKRQYDSNHECLERVNQPICKHLVAKKLFNFAFSLFQSNSQCLLSHKYYFRAFSNYGKEIKKTF